jgi:lipoprotein-anchoring transpeptidase ErfK/SrfK
MNFIMSVVALFLLFTGPGTPAAIAGEVVAFDPAAEPGAIIVRTSERKLYLVLGGGRALRYPVAVGKVGRQWSGASFIEGKHIRPNWAPPAAVRLAQPNLPAVIASGSPANPMGAAALTLSGGEYAIHGTNRPESIGKFVSYGCIRMYNEDIIELYARVSIGAPVVVVR